MLCARLVGARFHAFYENYEIVVSVWPLTIVEGDAPSWVREKVMNWAVLHQQELLAAWNRCLAGQRPGIIAPLA
jgi:hypothetical protein